MDFKQFNKGFQSIDWNIDTKGWPFKKVADLGDGYTMAVSGWFFTKSKLYGKLNPVAIGPGFLVGFSDTQTETIKALLDNADAVAAVKRGECYIKIRKYHSDKYNKDGFSFDFIDKPNDIF